MNFCLPSRSCWSSAWWTSSRSLGGRAEETREVKTAASQHTVLNEPKHMLGPTSSDGATPRSNGASRMLPAPYYYDNNPKGVVAAPIYSTIEPRTELHSLSHSATITWFQLNNLHWTITIMRIYPLHSQMWLASVCLDWYHPELSLPVLHTWMLSKTYLTSNWNALRFNYWVQKPRGPRYPLTEGSRLEKLTGWTLIQFCFIYMAPNHNNSCLKTFYIVKTLQ